MAVPRADTASTSTVPAPGGVTTVSVGSETVSVVAGCPPNVTEVTPASPLPEIVTRLPPTGGPLAGCRPVIRGLPGGVLTGASPHRRAGPSPRRV